MFQLTDGVEFLSQFPQSITAIAGQTISMYCIISANPLPHTFVWSNGSMAIGETDHISISNEVTGFIMNSTLTIKNVQLSDEGIYMCSFNNAVSVNSRIIKLIINCKSH